jgi:hypothetical protein
MSRRVTFLALAVSAALIATQASAAPDCSGDACNTKPARSGWFGRSEKTLPREAAPTLVEAPLAADGRGPGYEMNGRTRRAYGPYDPADEYGYDGYVVGFPYAVGPIGFVGPNLFYGGYLGRPVYLFAPNAKIIRLDRGDN